MPPPRRWGSACWARGSATLQNAHPRVAQRRTPSRGAEPRQRRSGTSLSRVRPKRPPQALQGGRRARPFHRQEGAKRTTPGAHGGRTRAACTIVPYISRSSPWLLAAVAGRGVRRWRQDWRFEEERGGDLAVATRPAVGHDAWTVSKRAAVSNSRLRLASQGACSRPRRRPRDTARLGRPPVAPPAYEVTRAGTVLQPRRCQELANTHQRQRWRLERDIKQRIRGSSI